MTVDLRLTRRLVLALSGCLLALPAWSQAALSIKPLAEKHVDRLPEGDLFWRIENFPSEAEAAAAATPWSLNVKAAGKVWLFTLGAPGRASERAAPVAEVGPIPRVSATEYLAENISDQAARDTLGQEFPELFCHTKATKASLAWRPDAGPGARRRLQAALGLPKLEPDLRQVVAATRRRLARNRQQTLATIVLMGINRIVVTDGRIVSKIKFDRVRR